jgi:Phosphotransferase system, mannose/fructose/N-acetylgalactosamine-specific component IIC
MSLFQALLIALWAGYCSYDDQGPQMLRRPLLIGPVVGLILGDFTAGLIVSATLELTWMGLGNMAGYRTPDMIIGTIVGITVAIQTGTSTSPEGIAAGVAAATAVAVLAQQLLLLYSFVQQMFAPLADKIALTGDFNGILKINFIAIAFQFLIRAVPTFLVVYFSDSAVNAVLAIIPANILAGLGTATRLLPAVGLSILMTMMMKNILWPFLIFGFVCSTYLGLSILPVTLLSLAFAVFYMLVMDIKDKQNTMPTSSVVNDEKEEVYDL